MDEGYRLPVVTGFSPYRSHARACVTVNPEIQLPPVTGNPIDTPDARADLAEQAAACRRLWAAVALVALADAELDPHGPAAAYLDTADFRTVADLAGLDPHAAQQRVAAIAARLRATKELSR